ncbi:hypothetical protein RHMOL_Rhmol09G0030400 [Rhododendron molle]|uniref:Uncharacterized protein n=1 Tax=Rhododendron molle TaxID=49168 RepID=A0ACC0M948_RHOML|nr:hypothetical protein RHMOL_Rhmol09G0030400 [Rhododendron molle]
MFRKQVSPKKQHESGDPEVGFLGEPSGQNLSTVLHRQTDCLCSNLLQSQAMKISHRWTQSRLKQLKPHSTGNLKMLLCKTNSSKHLELAQTRWSRKSPLWRPSYLSF